jgi:hypothetical protein
MDRDKELLPEIVTLAAVTDSVPIDISDPDLKELIDFSVLKEAFHIGIDWADFTPLQATEYLFDHYANMTTGLAKLNPGYENINNLPNLHPPLTGEMDASLVDYIVKERLFTFFLVDGCIPGTKEYRLMSKMAKSNMWASPIAVWGYDNSQNLGGSVFEAETNCNMEHNMGQIASAGINNLAYLSSKPAITEPVDLPPPPEVSYDEEKTYVSLVVGDGDNLSIVKGRNLPWALARMAQCSNKECPPFTWTMSPHLLYSAPDMMQFFIDLAKTTKADYFMLPPSGDLYSYPGMMDDENREKYVKVMEEDFRMFGCKTTVHWEWFYGWKKSLSNYFPLFNSIEGTGARGFFLTNVPYFIPMPFIFGREEYKIIGDNVVLFKPREWRGIDGSSHQSMSVENMAKNINSLEKGTITHVYLTSDGDNSIDSFYNLAALLDEHVVLVNADTLTELALQRGRR